MSDTASTSSPEDSLIVARLCEEYEQRISNGEDISIDVFLCEHEVTDSAVRSALQAVQLLGTLNEREDWTQQDLPSQIAGCEIQRVIGSGGMGVVLEASHPTVSRRLAIKLLKCRTGQRPEFRDRLLREAEAASRLLHPNIVPFIDCGEHNGRPYISMLHIDGEKPGQIAASSCFRGGLRQRAKLDCE